MSGRGSAPLGTPPPAPRPPSCSASASAAKEGWVATDAANAAKDEVGASNSSVRSAGRTPRKQLYPTASVHVSRRALWLKCEGRYVTVCCAELTPPSPSPPFYVPLQAGAQWGWAVRAHCTGRLSVFFNCLTASSLSKEVSGVFWGFIGKQLQIPIPKERKTKILCPSRHCLSLPTNPKSMQSASVFVLSFGAHVALWPTAPAFHVSTRSS